MTIDIISFTDAQYAALNETQLQEVINAQTKKDNLALELAERKRKERFRLTKNGVFRSGIYEALCAQWDTEYQAELEVLKAKLLFYLRFALKPQEPSVEAPYTVDYSLEYADRYKSVRDYYLSAYSDADERMTAYQNDEVAPQYLGEFYATLYDYLLVLTRD